MVICTLGFRVTQKHTHHCRVYISLKNQLRSPSPSPSRHRRAPRLHLITAAHRVSISLPRRLHLRYRCVSVSVTAASPSPRLRFRLHLHHRHRVLPSSSSTCHPVHLHHLRLKVRWLHFHHINTGNLGLTPFRMTFTVEPEACTRFL